MMDGEIATAPPPDGESTVRAPASSDNQAQTKEFNAMGLKFAFSKDQLNRMITTKDLPAFHAMGGLLGLEAGLRTGLTAGLDDDGPKAGVGNSRTARSHIHKGERLDSKDRVTASTVTFADRKDTYGENKLPPKERRTFWQFAWIAFNDKLMLLLTASAIVNLALGIYQSTSGESKVEWVEGASIIVAVVVIVLVSAVNDFQKDRKFQSLNKQKEERNVIVVRGGQEQHISIHDILVGDIVHLETGDIIPADGILVLGFSIQCDESSATGESDLIDKAPALKERTGGAPNYDPFILSGSTVANGVGTFLVVSVGPNSSYGRIMMSLRSEEEVTPLQQKLGELAKYIINAGLIIGGIFFLIIFIRYLVQLKHLEGSKAKGEEFLNILILSITVIVIAVPEGLSLTVTMALAFATTRMLKDNNLVRLLRSCEVMGNATTVCSDKTGTLTQNKMTVVAGRVGTSAPFESFNTADGPERVIQHLSSPVQGLIKDSIVFNSTALEKVQDGNTQLIGSSTEVALIEFAIKNFAFDGLNEERQKAQIVELFPFNANRKCMAAVLRTPAGYYRLFAKGAPEVITTSCTQVLVDPHLDVTSQPLENDIRSDIADSLIHFSSRSLRSIALAYRDFEQWPPQLPQTDSNSLFEYGFQQMTMIGIFALRDPLRPGVTQSVHDFQSAGVSVRMVTGDTFLTAKAIALECGIYQPGGIAIDSSVFRKLSAIQLDTILPRLQILARSSPEDKLRLVTHLKGAGETVAVTGDGTNDALALKAADVGFAMGIQGTEVAKEASSIILMDDNFASIGKAMLWGRAVNDAAKRFLQFQFTINFTAGILTIVSALSGGTNASVFTVVQLLWINLIMDTFAALALATDKPTRSLLKRAPEPRGPSIINVAMWKMIVGQSIYQLIVIFTLYYGGDALFHYNTSIQKSQLQTMTFNIYVWMQFFNMINSRRVDDGFNLFDGIWTNYSLFFVQAVIAIGQIIIIFKGGQAFGTVPLNAVQWGWTMLFGLLTFPVGFMIRLVPDRVVTVLFSRILSILQVLVSLISHIKRNQRRDKTPSVITTAVQSRRNEQTGLLAPVTGGDMAEGDGSFDLTTAIQAARRANNGMYGLELHPGTPANDLVIGQLQEV